MMARRNGIRIIVAKALGLVLILSLSPVAGCGRGKTIAIDRSQSMSPRFNLVKSFDEWKDDFSDVVGTPVRENDTEFVSLNKVGNGSILLAIHQGETLLIKMDEQYQIQEVVSCGEAEKWKPIQFFPGSDDSMTLLFQSDEGGLWERKFALQRFDSNGFATSQLFELSSMDGKVIRGFDYSGSGLFGILTDTEVQVYEADGSLQNQIVATDSQNYRSFIFGDEERLMILSVGKNNQPSLLESSVSKEEALTAQEISGMNVDEWYNARLIRATDSNTAACYIETQKNVFAYFPEGDRIVHYFDKTAEGLYNDMPMHSTGPNTFELFGFLGIPGLMSSEDNSGEYGFLSIAIAPRGKDVTTIKVGLCCNFPERLSIYSGLFARKYPQYAIEVFDYTLSAEEGVDPISKLNADILSGSGPDIICVSPQYLSRYDKSGMLMNLEEWVDTDAWVDSSLLMPGAWGTSSNSSATYWVAPFVSLDGFMGDIQWTSQMETLDLNAFSTYINTLPNETHIIRHDTVANLFDAMYPFFEHTLILEDANGLRFDRDRFMSWVTFCENFGKSPYTDSTPVAVQFLNEETLLLGESVLNYEIFLGFAEYFGGDVGYVGVPGSHNGKPILSSDQYYGVSATASDPEAARAFLEHLLSEDVQSRYATEEVSGNRMPVLYSAFDAMLKDGYTRYMEGESMRISLYSDTEMEQENERIDTIIQAVESGKSIDDTQANRPAPYAFAEKDMAATFTAIVLSAEPVLPVNPEVKKIIFEEMSAYFSGQKTKEACADIIEQRLQTYINEQD